MKTNIDLIKTLEETTKLADRVIFIDEDSESLDQSLGKTLVQEVHRLGEFKKVYFLKGGFRSFFALYPFLCVSDPAPHIDYLQARARYPTEILSKTLYLGGVVHLTNPAQLEKVGFRTLIDCFCGVKSGRNIPEIRLDLTEDGEIDFETTIAIISACEKPVFLYCLNGENQSAAVAAAYLAHVKGIKSEHALAYIVSKRPDVKLTPEVFFQLQNFRKNEPISSIPRLQTGNSV